MSSPNFNPQAVAHQARMASQALPKLDSQDRNDALIMIHDMLAAGRQEILNANALDLAAVSGLGTIRNLNKSLLQRLNLDSGTKFDDMLQGVINVKGLADPLNQVDVRTVLETDLTLERHSTPIGVILVIFEARPEVMVNVTALAIKSGNAVLLKGGKEGSETNKTIFRIIQLALAKTSVPRESVQLIASRAAIEALLHQDENVDLVIPRGSKSLVSFVKNHSRIPVLSHADGICCIYLRADCSITMAIEVILDAKASYPAACNSVETLLVDEKALRKFFPTVAKKLLAEGIQLRCDELCRRELSLVLGMDEMEGIAEAVEEDYVTEFSDLTLAIKTVPYQGDDTRELDIATEHINRYSSHHTDAILTEDAKLARRFQNNVDSACVFWNASTRMADGKRFGFGAEVGISTSKIHSRGPVGLQGLTTYRWYLDGHGHTSANRCNRTNL